MAAVDLLRDRETSGLYCQLMVCDIEPGSDGELEIKARFADWTPALSGEIVLVGERGESIVIKVPESVTEARSAQFLIDAVYPVVRVGA